MREKLQFTLFAKMLALTASVVFGALFYYYHHIVQLFEPFIDQEELKQSLFWMTYFAAGVIAIGLVSSSYLIALSVTSPIKKLVKLTGKVSKGDFNITVDSITPLPSDEIGLLSSHFISMAGELEKRQRTQGLLKKLHGKELSEKFLEGALENQAKLKQVSVMFIDIQNFTQFAESNPPRFVLDQLNHFFEQCGEVILRHGGVIDKFMGDSLMAIWGILDEDNKKEDNNLKAFNCAKEISNLNLDFQIGIGLHCGPAILGSVGTSSQRDYTVIGDTVNTASRLEKASRSLQTNLIISRNVMDDIKEGKEPFGKHELILSGKLKTVEVYTYLNHKSSVFKKAS